MPVSPANRKRCAECGVDVTFARRSTDAKGRQLCLNCAKALESVFKFKSDSNDLEDFEDGLSLLEKLEPQTTQKLPTDLENLKAKSPIAREPDRSKPGSPTALWITAGAVAVIIIVAICLLLTHKGWDEQNRSRIESIKADAEQLLHNGDPKSAYYRYKDLFTFVGDHEIQDDFIKTELDMAKGGMDTAHTEAAPLIAKEEEEARQRQAEQQRLAAERAAAELAQKQKEEAERQQQLVAKAAEEAAANERASAQRRAAAQRAIRETARALLLKSSEFADWQRQANSIVTQLSTDLITEDSAYRGMSRRAKAARDLLALYVKAEGHLQGTVVDSSADHILSVADTEQITEDSAIRAIYEHDQTFLKLLGLWCQVLDSHDRALQQIYLSHSSNATVNGIGDDSAIRAIDNYSGACMHVLEAVATAEGFGSQADSITSTVRTQNIGDDSAWRVAMNNEQGNMRLLLLLVVREDPATASKIESDATTAIAGDDSALRAQAAYLQGNVDALHWLVGHP